MSSALARNRSSLLVSRVWRTSSRCEG